LRDLRQSANGREKDEPDVVSSPKAFGPKGQKGPKPMFFISSSFSSSTVNYLTPLQSFFVFLLLVFFSSLAPQPPRPASSSHQAAAAPTQPTINLREME